MDLCYYLPDHQEYDHHNPKYLAPVLDLLCNASKIADMLLPRAAPSSVCLKLEPMALVIWLATTEPGVVVTKPALQVLVFAQVALAAPTLVLYWSCTRWTHASASDSAPILRQKHVSNV